MPDTTNEALAIKQENIKYHQTHFLVNRGRTFNPPKSTTTQGQTSFKKKVHQDLKVLKTQVRVFPSQAKDHLIPYPRLKGQSFRAGQIFLSYEKWMQLTSNPHAVHTTAGETIEFSSCPVQVSNPPNSICKDHVALVEAEIFIH